MSKWSQQDLNLKKKIKEIQRKRHKYIVGSFYIQNLISKFTAYLWRFFHVELDYVSRCDFGLLYLFHLLHLVISSPKWNFWFFHHRGKPINSIKAKRKIGKNRVKNNKQYFWFEFLWNGNWIRRMFEKNSYFSQRKPEVF